MFSHYHPRHAGQPTPPPPPKGRTSETRDARHDDQTSTALAAMYAAGKDAARHGSAAARIWAWQAGDTIRGGVFKLFLGFMAAIALVGAVITIAVWGTANLLSALATAAGGGLFGTAVALIGVSALLAVGVTVIMYSRQRGLAAARRERLEPSPHRGAVPEATEMEQMQQSAMGQLHADKDRLVNASAALLREHPIASIGASATSGFFVGRWLRRSPKGVRRAAIGVLRAGRAAGFASVMSTVADSFGRSTSQASGPENSTSEPPESQPPESQSD